MSRVPISSDELQKFIGKTITKEMLWGRGYFHVQESNVVEDNFPRLKELSWEEDDDNDTLPLDVNGDGDEEEEIKITCKLAKRYIASQIENFISNDFEYWIKGLPAEPEDVDDQEVYMIICIGTKPVDSGLEIVNITILARMVEQMGSGCFSIPGAASLESNFFEMQMLPPELLHELEFLIARRFIPENFTLIGAPMPENKNIFHPNPPYSLACNSGWRNVYWHLSINVDENDIIQDLELSTYERETSMFQRPYCMDDDMTEAFDAALMIVNQYTDEEWNKIIH